MPRPRKQKRENPNPQRRANVRAKLFVSHFEQVDQKIQKKWRESRERASKIGQYKAAVNILLLLASNLEHSCGAMTLYCERGCRAVHYPNKSTRHICCFSIGANAGKGSFSLLNPLPEFLRDKLYNDGEFRRYTVYPAGTLVRD